MQVADLRARAWAQYGNALRLCGQPKEAEEAFATTQRHYEAGSSDPMLRAWLLERFIAFAVFQNRFGDAMQMCEEAEAIHRESGKSHHLASTLVQKAIAVLYFNEAEGAIKILNEAIPLLDSEEDPHLGLAAHHNLVCCYIHVGRPEEALALHYEARQLYREYPDPLILLRATWQEGQILREVGHLRNAEAALLRARQGFAEQRLAYEAALVSLDLAEVYSKLDLLPELRRILGEALPIFRALKVGPETLASLLRLQQAAGQQDDSS